MKKLEDIPKKNIFEVPDGYFDQFALNIQSRTEQLTPTKADTAWRITFRYALPTVALIIGAIFILRPKAVQDTEQLLASVPTEHLIAYLHECEISEQDLLEAINFDDGDADSLNMHVHKQYLPDEFDLVEFKSVMENEL